VNFVGTTRVVVIVFGALCAATDVRLIVVAALARRRLGVVWQHAAIVLSKGAVGLIVSGVIIAVGAGSYTRPLTYALVVAVAGNLVLRVYMRRRYPDLFDLND
jgi:hypothetical protein